MWAYVKRILRKLKARTEDKLISAINTALSAVTKELVTAWMKHCKYGL
jgi:hypothetical protein